MTNEPSKESKERKSTFMPLVIAIGLALFILGFATFNLLIIAGVIIMAMGLLKTFKDDMAGKFAKPDSPRERWPFEFLGKDQAGVWIFLMSEILLFGSLIVAYLYVRLSSAGWPIATQLHNPIIAMANTIILLTSGLAMALALNSIRNGSTKGLIAGLAGAFILGVVFLEIKLGFEWTDEIRKGFVITSGLPASSYYMLTGLHAAHVAAGLIIMLYLIGKAFGGGFTATNHSAVSTTALYWAFVDIVWMLLFPLFYLI